MDSPTDSSTPANAMSTPSHGASYSSRNIDEDALRFIFQKPVHLNDSDATSFAETLDITARTTEHSYHPPKAASNVQARASTHHIDVMAPGLGLRLFADAFHDVAPWKALERNPFLSSASKSGAAAATAARQFQALRAVFRLAQEYGIEYRKKMIQEKIFDKNAAYAKARDGKFEKMREAQQKILEAEATFSPKISDFARSSAHHKSINDYFPAGQEWLKRKEKKLNAKRDKAAFDAAEELREEIAAAFQMSPNSTAILAARKERLRHEREEEQQRANTDRLSETEPGTLVSTSTHTSLPVRKQLDASSSYSSPLQRESTTTIGIKNTGQQRTSTPPRGCTFSPILSNNSRELTKDLPPFQYRLLVSNEKKSMRLREHAFAEQIRVELPDGLDEVRRGPVRLQEEIDLTVDRLHHNDNGCAARRLLSRNDDSNDDVHDVLVESTFSPLITPLASLTPSRHMTPTKRQQELEAQSKLRRAQAERKSRSYVPGGLDGLLPPSTGRVEEEQSEVGTTPRRRLNDVIVSPTMKDFLWRADAWDSQRKGHHEQVLREHENKFQQVHRFHPFTSPKTREIMAEKDRMLVAEQHTLHHHQEQPTTSDSSSYVNAELFVGQRAQHNNNTAAVMVRDHGGFSSSTMMMPHNYYDHRSFDNNPQLQAAHSARTFNTGTTSERHSSSSAAVAQEATTRDIDGGSEFEAWRPLEAIAQNGADSSRPASQAHHEQKEPLSVIHRMHQHQHRQNKQQQHVSPAAEHNNDMMAPSSAQTKSSDPHKAAVIRELVRYGLHGTRINVAYASPFRTPLQEQRDNGMITTSTSSPKKGSRGRLPTKQHEPFRTSSGISRRHPQSTSVMTFNSTTGGGGASSPHYSAMRFGSNHSDERLASPPRDIVARRGVSGDFVTAAAAATPPSGRFRSPTIGLRSGTVTSSVPESQAHLVTPPPGIMQRNTSGGGASYQTATTPTARGGVQLDRDMVDELKNWWVELTTTNPSQQQVSGNRSALTSTHGGNGHNNLSLLTHDALLAAVELVTTSTGASVARKSALSLLAEFPRSIVFADFVLLVEKLFAIQQQQPRRLYH
ncbi:Hypothetical protein, putative [Bodo saltans]|uniref:Uncharacterized protein n=1 Tax=Bodo saltans TaxID=75058 RepID=A0A0S4JG38_BODSA|nr:Hypothetical protein, putative [Bodo saltans]|eukprot:CUG88167.1 Hypothetical protein, putative [Bodo saltans]